MIIMESKVIIVKRFNPEKELNKIRNGNKNKILYSIIALLLIVAVGSTYALYQVRHSNKLTHIIVKQFYQNDLDLAVYVDGIKKVTKEEFPTKENGTNLVYTGIKCEDETQINASWDYNDWALDVESKLPNKCNVYFETKYRDNSGANYPELYQGLIPITIEENTGIIKVADLASKWYDYDAHEWANAVLVTTEKYNELVDENGKLKDDAKNKVLTLSKGDGTNADGDILQMYVWIPRYRYQLFNTLDRGVDPQAIDIKFESVYSQKSNGQKNGEWLTHPAFTFGNTELSGIWVGKFEPSEKEIKPSNTGNVNVANSAITDITILPNKVSIVFRKVSAMFNATLKIKEDKQYNLNVNEVDTHMMKNIEWGAVAYLSQSIYGIFNKTANNGKITCAIDTKDNESTCRIWNNNVDHGGNDGTITGCSATSADQGAIQNQIQCADNRTWEKEGTKSSTTGNVYGIYDMVGGMWEYVMGNMAGEDGEFYNSSAGFEEPNANPDPKYYDSYSYDATSETTQYRGHLGDATKEILQTYGNDEGTWNGDYAHFPFGIRPWFRRGGLVSSTTRTGIFAFHTSAGVEYASTTFRVVLTAQDNVK